MYHLTLEDYQKWSKKTTNEITEWEYNQHPCRHREHEPPGYMVIRKTYVHTCPGCGRKITIKPTQIYL